MQRFKTLMLREWMQHRTGWLVVLALPFMAFALALVFGDVKMDLARQAGSDELPPTPLMMALVMAAGVALTTLLLAWAAALIQSPGLARRDVQDRSIEFWLSLPASHAQSLGATLLMHLLVLPWVALGVGLAGGLLLSVLAVGKGFGFAAWFALPWGPVLAALLAMAMRLALGIALATLWLSPLILMTMAASAWLKRWGVPAVAGVLGLGGLLLDKVYDNPIVWDVLERLLQQAGRAFMVAGLDDNRTEFIIETPGALDAALGSLPAWALHDAGRALAALASPAFLAALAVGAGGFALLWLRRQRGA